MSGVDQRGRLQEDPFEARITKDGKVFVYYEGKQVKVLSGKPAAKLIRQLADADEQETQLALAKAAGNFKRGNQRQRR